MAVVIKQQTGKAQTVSPVKGNVATKPVVTQKPVTITVQQQSPRSILTPPKPLVKQTTSPPLSTGKVGQGGDKPPVISSVEKVSPNKQEADNLLYAKSKQEFEKKLSSKWTFVKPLSQEVPTPGATPTPTPGGASIQPTATATPGITPPCVIQRGPGESDTCSSRQSTPGTLSANEREIAITIFTGLANAAYNAGTNAEAVLESWGHEVAYALDEIGDRIWQISLYSSTFLGPQFALDGMAVAEVFGAVAYGLVGLDLAVDLLQGQETDPVQMEWLRQNVGEDFYQGEIAEPFLRGLARMVMPLSQ